MSLATAFVLTLSSAVAYLLHQYLLVPLRLEYLRTIAFILVIAASVQFTEIMVRRLSPLLDQVLLEGRPQNTVDPNGPAQPYRNYAYDLARQGFVTYAPQNPYIGQDAFRVLQRKANPLKLSLQLGLRIIIHGISRSV